nr:hypothetical protein [Rhodoferax sp. MIZ03]
MKPPALSTLSMSPTTSLVSMVLAHVVCRLSMRLWIKSANPLIGFALNFNQMFANFAYQVSLTTFSIGLWVGKLKFWSSRLIGGDLDTGLAGFSGLIDPACASVEMDLEMGSGLLLQLPKATATPAA